MKQSPRWRLRWWRHLPMSDNVTDRAGIEPRVARSRVQRLNHWAIKVPERPSRLRLASSLHYSPLFEIRAPWLGPLSTKAGSFHSQANPGYRCHQCNGPCGYRTPGRSLQSPTPKPLGHKGTWTTQSLTLGWFVTDYIWSSSEENRLLANDPSVLPLLHCHLWPVLRLEGNITDLSCRSVVISTPQVTAHRWLMFYSLTHEKLLGWLTFFHKHNK